MFARPQGRPPRLALCLLNLLLLTTWSAPGMAANVPAANVPAVNVQESKPPNATLPDAKLPVEGAAYGRTAEIPFTWEPVEGALAYRLVVVEGSTWKEAYTAADLASTSHTLPGSTLAAGSYRYTVVARMADGRLLWSPWRSFAVAADGATAPAPVAPPTVVEPAPQGRVAVQDLKVRWEPVAGAQRYRLILYDGTTGSPLLEAAPTAPAFTIASRYLAGDRRYLIALAAVGAGVEQWSYRAFTTEPVRYSVQLSAEPNPVPAGQPAILSASVQPATNVSQIRLTSDRTGAVIGRIASASGQVAWTPRERVPDTVIAEVLDAAGNVLATQRLRLLADAQLTQPDLTVSYLSAPATAQQDQQITVRWRVYNAGPTFGSSFTHYLYLQRNGQDLPMESWVEPPMGAGEEREGSATLSLTDVPKGTYALCFHTDVNGAVSEADEGNNLRCTTRLVVTLPPAEGAPPPPPAPVSLPAPGSVNPLFPGAVDSPGPALPTRTPVLTWEPAANAEGYRVTIREYPYGTQDVVYQVNTNATFLQVPPKILKLGTWYRWEVQPFNTSRSGGRSSPRYFKVSSRYQMELSRSLVLSSGPYWVLRLDVAVLDRNGQPLSGQEVKLTARQGYLLPASGSTDSAGRFTAYLSFTPTAGERRFIVQIAVADTQHEVDLFPAGSMEHDALMTARLQAMLAANLAEAKAQRERAEGLSRAACPDAACQLEEQRRFLLAWLASAAGSDPFNPQNRPGWGDGFRWTFNDERIAAADLRWIALGYVSRAVFAWLDLTPEDGLAQLSPRLKAEWRWQGDPAAWRAVQMGFDYYEGAPRDR